ncbi:hypothetical protein [Paenibacillus sp. NAIST15-1]|uniref:hypothetical protein n=1 Tax=Paenibacillus sp. NAIST15-1 TaxID=1605994 RepID=UPI00086B80E3|nr:hypothetical protein [Paenibacillus sp. NAIST15-1]GAV11430.1 beta-galactosidase [Paenibacillus sp. NAIST15-1]
MEKVFKNINKFDLYNLQGKTLTFKLTKDVMEDGVYECMVGIDLSNKSAYIFDTRYQKNEM